MSSPTELNNARAVPLPPPHGVPGLLRFIGPVAALMGLGLIGLFLYQSGALTLPAARDPKPKPGVEFPEQVSGTNATISGRDSSQNPFEIKATKGQQDKAVKTLVHMQEVTGHFDRDGGGRLNLEANAGRYDTGTKALDLEGQVTFVEPGRMKAMMEKARIDTSDQTLTADVPVTVEMQGTTIRAGSLRVSDHGDRIYFKGGVKARFVTKPTQSGDGG